LSERNAWRYTLTASDYKIRRSKHKK
jgi:hypothetical protein